MESIEFHTSPPRYCVADFTLACTASVDGMPACYAVTAEALEEHSDARSWWQEDLLQAMESHRGTVEDMARPLFKLTDSYSIMLRSGHFRFDMQLSREQHSRHLRLRWI